MTQIAGYTVAFLICLAIFAKARSRMIRQTTLLIASYALYISWGIWFAAVLLTSTVVNFIVGRNLRRRPSGFTLFFGIAFNLALLGTFKYLPEASVQFPFSSLQPFAHLAMPLGISFWTFQAMSYLFDLYQGEEMDSSFGEFALYLAFFPVTISGPVCRLAEMLPQFRSEEALQWSKVSRGFQRIATGVLMMQLAKLLGQGILASDGINSGFDRLTQWSGPDVWCLTIGYGLQLFFDFAGYSHIAIGAAQALGLTLPENFRRPFGSTSPSMFWTRWHMSLSFWIRDYVFFPLAQMSRQVWWRNLCLVISMTLFGVWHKASLLFVIWGLYHGVLLALHRQVEAAERNYDWNPPEPLWTASSWISTMVLMNLGWVFFRAKSLRQAKDMMSAVLSPGSYRSHFLSGSSFLLVLSTALGYAIVLLVHDLLDRKSEAMHERALSSENSPTRRNSVSDFATTIVQWRWYWITPLYFIALLFLLIVTSSQGTSTAQLIYGNF